LTILELLIVVATLGLIIAIAVPSLTASRKSANETAAATALRYLVSMNEQYRLRFGRYAPSPADLNNAGFELAGRMTGEVTGYRFEYEGEQRSWRCRAVPVNPGVTGDIGYYADEHGLVRAAPWAVVGPDSSPLDGLLLAAQTQSASLSN
jgi:type II secretory pathway pseudopilin PulG